MESVTDKELADLEQKIEAEAEKVSEPEPQPETEVTKVEAEPALETDAAAVPTKELEPSESKPDADIYKKKGWKGPEDAIRSYQELEKEFHKKNDELRAMKERAPYEPPPPPSYAPPVNPYGPPPVAPSYGYQPSLPPPPVGSQAEAQLADSYNMTVEDFRRIFPMVNDMTEVKNRRTVDEFYRWKDQLSRETEKNTDRTNVLGDPAFYNPEVQNEMHEFFSKNPQVFNERKPYSIGLRAALENIGRKNTTRGAQSRPASLPTEPPKTASSGSGFSGKKTSLPSERDFKSMSLEDQEKMLKGLKAFKTYDDL